MKARYLFLIAIGLALSVCVLASDETVKRSTDSEPDTSQLQQKVRALESKVRDLEERLRKVESQRPPATIWIPSPNSVKPGQQHREVLPDCAPPPRIWGKREINGMTFYIVPCGGESGGVPDGSKGQN